uniref:Glycosyltransferase 61 catalytic domain-containing protein n=1 Tax=Chromera velia CCMP2878 TaxID=1169474 RepID=A0A0G4H9U9_9ALVE|eukprot:Cvel_25483.t1-p1 / transcript=Cvel_25483.t1 / gene=Cvel_25483 / organism=Chromera_velia_CCMP2878 / gene_product=hypothetical protein / transcript_product=hypothetical protein / location=Cvel_scaffold2894:6149-11216(+) / protein_length=640 / sequence_SO=supercontig / SO=protein_coding / is_pseudo=false
MSSRARRRQAAGEAKGKAPSQQGEGVGDETEETAKMEREVLKTRLHKNLWHLLVIVGMGILGAVLSMVLRRFLSRLSDRQCWGPPKKRQSLEQFMQLSVDIQKMAQKRSLCLRDEKPVVTLQRDFRVKLRRLSHPADAKSDEERAEEDTRLRLLRETVHTARPKRRSPSVYFRVSKDSQSPVRGAMMKDEGKFNSEILEQPEPFFTSLYFVRTPRLFPSYEGILFNTTHHYNSALFQDVSGLFQQIVNENPHTKNLEWTKRSSVDVSLSSFTFSAFVKAAERKTAQSPKLLEYDGLYDEIGFFSEKAECRDAPKKWKENPSVIILPSLIQGLSLYQINYYHFVVETVPLLFEYARILKGEGSEDEAGGISENTGKRKGRGKRSKGGLDAHTRVLLYDTPMARDASEVAGIPSDRIVWYDPCMLYFGVEVIVPSVRESAFFESASALERTRQLVMGSPLVRMGILEAEGERSSSAMETKTKKKVLIVQREAKGGEGKRGSDRVMLNRSPFFESVKRLFESEDGEGWIVEELVPSSSVRWRDQVLKFHQASIVIGVEGAALASTLFCERGTVVVNMIPVKDHVSGYGDWLHGQEYYWNVAESVGLKHRAILLEDFRFDEPLVVPVEPVVQVLRQVKEEVESS